MNTKATYKGNEYSAYIKKNGKILLRSRNILDIEKYGFWIDTMDDFKKMIKQYGMKIDESTSDDIYKCFKHVEKDEVEAFYEVNETAEYMGHMAYIMSEIDGMLTIIIDNLTEEQALDLNMDERCERHSHAKTINKKDAIIHVEKKLIFSNK